MMMEAALGVDAAPLLAMQNEYDMLMAERDASFMEKLKQIRRIAAIF
jgi:plasmid maintenance system antidote protein VapI